MSNSKQNELIITLSCRGEDLYSLNSKDFIEEISIGRSSECTWSVGHVDSATSSRHAMISKRKNDLYLTDLGSRNGVYLHERKIKEVKLASGMIFHFGECTLTVADPNVKTKVKLKPCYLRYTDENGKRCKFKIMSGTTRIGSGAKCDIVLNSGLVSTPHASISRKKDGSCWLKDLNSRNGTSVNGMELPGKVERMLKNGDVISVADIEMIFYDGSSERHTLKLTAALLTLAATLLVCVGAYFFWLQFTPASFEFLQKARAAAREADFAEARRLVASAATARKSSATQAERKLFLAQIETWENSAKRLARLHFLLKNQQFAEVPQLIGTMDLEYIASWDWNEKTAVNIKQELELIKKLFGAFNRTEMVFNDSEASPAELAVISKSIRELTALLRNNPKESVRNLLKFAENTDAKIAAVSKAHGAFSKVMEKLSKSGSCDLTVVIAELEALQRNYRLPFIMGRIENVLPVLYALQNSEKQLVASRKLLSDMRFKECVASVVAIPENKLRLAGVDQRIEVLRKESQLLKRVASDLYILHGSLVRQNIQPGSNVPSLEAFMNKKEMAQVFNCDTLTLPPAPKSRNNPVGIYDKYVGIEYLYGALVMIRSNDTVRSRYVIPFEPLLERAIFHLGLITYFKEYAEGNGKKYIGSGKLKNYLKYLDSQLLLRDRIVNTMKRNLVSFRKSSREYFIAHGIAYSFKPQSYTYAQREKIGKEFASFRVRMQELNRKYNTALPEEAIQIRDQILKEGLPGDPVVKRMWSLR